MSRLRHAEGSNEFLGLVGPNDAPSIEYRPLFIFKGKKRPILSWKLAELTHVLPGTVNFSKMIETENSETRFLGLRPRPRLYIWESQWRDETETFFFWVSISRRDRDFFLLSLNVETRPRLFWSLNIETRPRLLYKTWLLSFYVKSSLFSLIEKMLHCPVGVFCEGRWNYWA